MRLVILFHMQKNKICESAMSVLNNALTSSSPDCKPTWFARDVSRETCATMLLNYGGKILIKNAMSDDVEE
jgi:hypothetical protein